MTSKELEQRMLANLIKMQKDVAECRALIKDSVSVMERIFISQVESGQVEVDLVDLPEGVIAA